MSPPAQTPAAASPRLVQLQARQAKLEEQRRQLQAQVSREHGKLRAQERHARTRHLIAYGRLVAWANFQEEDQRVILGVLLEGARRVEEAGQRQQWHEAGERCLAERRGARQETTAAAPVAEEESEEEPAPTRVASRPRKSRASSG